MIKVAVTWEEGEKREGLYFAIANHMKKCYLLWNKDTVDDKVIFDHLYELSDGKIDLRKSEEQLVSPERLNNNNNTNSNTHQNNQNNNRSYTNNNQNNNRTYNNNQNSNRNNTNQNSTNRTNNTNRNTNQPNNRNQNARNNKG